MPGPGGLPCRQWTGARNNEGGCGGRRRLMTSQGEKPIDRGNHRGKDFKRPSAGVREMFSRIAGDYDLFNHTLSLNIDRLWRKRARKILEPHLSPDSMILDLCTGTGDLALESLEQAPSAGGAGAPHEELCLDLEENEHQAILRALKKTGWVKKAAADLLGISRRAIHYKIKKYGIPDHEE